MADIKKFQVVFVFIVIVCVGCSSEKPLELVNEYYFVRTNAYNTYIIKNDRPIVDSYVSDIEIFGIYIIGIRTKSEMLDLPNDMISRNYGYFILNSNSGELVEGLSEEYVENFKLNN